MKWSVANVLIAIPLLPLFPVIATWFLPWEDWIPKKFPKWFLGPYFLYVSYAAWHFHVGWFVILVTFVIGAGAIVVALEEKFNN
jgi:hypothetical protein